MTHSDISPDTPLQSARRKPQNALRGNLLGLLTLVFYGLFTLLPDSNSLMVSWPWVFIWQVGLLCPVLWLLGMLWQGQLHWLGNRLDWVVGVLVAGLILSAGLAEFPMQARWYSWAAFCFLAALYTLRTWLIPPERRLWLLTLQGYLNLVVIALSLLLWGTQTWLPELGRLHDLQQYGVSLPFSFSNIQLRNWAPFGHQNYVAGYLVLALPLLLALGTLQTGWRRWIWWGGFGLGLLDLYTTSSRAGWLGVGMLAIVTLAGLLWRGNLPRRWLGLAGGATIVILALVLGTNSRFQALLSGTISGNGGGEVAYRLITTATGWHMGLSRPWFGLGPGGVPLQFQRYRPAWAGQEAELAYQLHSTPAQLWAELGVWSVVTGVGAIGVLVFLSLRWLRQRPLDSATPRLLTLSLLAGLLGYSLVSLTDYQLDNVGISGTLVLFLAVLAAEFKHEQDVKELGALVEVLPETPIPPSRVVSLAGMGILLAALIWLGPIHRAWLLSSQAFTQLARENVNGFAQQLEAAYRLASWESYYSYQLGWNLGNLSLKTSDPQAQRKLLEDGISWFKQGIQDSPYQEFGHSNLGWLLLNRDPRAAAYSFIRSAHLVPAKRGVFYGLGLSLLGQGKTTQAVDAMVLETLRDPLLLTSPVWKLPQLQALYEPIVNEMETRYTTLLQQAQTSPALTAQLHQSRGALRWWRGNLVGARQDLASFGTPLSQIVLDLAEGKAVQSSLEKLEPGAGRLAIAAWLAVPRRQELLRQAWIWANHQAPPEEILQQLVESMARSTSLDQWLKQNAPSRPYRRERAGFGVLSRHIDGPIPLDFLTVVENIPMQQFFTALVPSFVYAPELDKALQSERDAFLKQVSGL